MVCHFLELAFVLPLWSGSLLSRKAHVVKRPTLGRTLSDAPSRPCFYSAPLFPSLSHICAPPYLISTIYPGGECMVRCRVA